MESVFESRGNITSFRNGDTHSNKTSVITDTIQEEEDNIINQPLNITLLVLSFLGLFANILSIAATLHVQHRQNTHLKLIINLAVSDICIILSVFLHLLETIKPPSVADQFCVGITNQGFLHFALLATLINLLAMAIDHYVAILKPLHYNKILSRFRGNVMLLLIWIISIIGGLLDMIAGAFTKTSAGSFCLHVYTDNFDAQIVILSLVLLELFVLLYLYVCIFLEVKKMLARHQSLNQDSMHSRKAIITTLLIVGTFMICWVPNSLYQIALFVMWYTERESLIISINNLILINTLLWILMLSNAVCDPIIYALRLSEVQQGYKTMFKRICNNQGCRREQMYSPTQRDTPTRTALSETGNEFHAADAIIVGSGLPSAITLVNTSESKEKFSMNEADPFLLGKE